MGPGRGRRHHEGAEDQGAKLISSRHGGLAAWCKVGQIRVQARSANRQNSYEFRLHPGGYYLPPPSALLGRRSRAQKRG